MKGFNVMYYKHTSGKWCYFKNADGTYTIYPEKCDKHPKFPKIVIAEVFTEEVKDGEANAKLMSVAPELCDVLEECVDVLKQLLSWDDKEPDLLKKVNDILIKAGR